MSTVYPNNLDSFATPGATLASNPHSSLHINEADAILALETKVGITGSAVTSTVDYKLSNAASVSPGHKHVVADISDAGAFIPTGAIIETTGTTTPTGGFLPADGSAISRTTYATLFAVIGTTYGVGDGSTTFNLPTLFNSFKGATFDFANSKTQSAATSISMSHTVGGTGGVLIAGFAAPTSNLSAAPQYGGVNMTALTATATGIQWYYLLSPAAGVANITASFSSQTMTAISVSYLGFSNATIGSSTASQTSATTTNMQILARTYPSLAVAFFASDDISATIPTISSATVNKYVISSSSLNVAIGQLGRNDSIAIGTFPSSVITGHIAYFTGIATSSIKYNYIKT